MTTKPTKSELASEELTAVMTIKMTPKLREQIRKAAFTRRVGDSVFAREVLADKVKRVQV